MKKVLIAEDDEIFQEIYKTALEEWGYKVITASDGQMALTLLQKEKPELAIIDIELPVMTGFQVMKAIKSSDNKKTPKIIAISRHDYNGMYEEIYEAGSDRYIAKPFDVNFLLEVIRELFPKKRTL